ncbi:hypothetical protein P168DRAFT_316525 [Aspergillus campestris IBT 28561]|uniref:Uncharacterized protein n=1 Tax=Aspergillus campestris (strain IBT 28561) TaxID=1392248 RepID=A0A2I1D9J8_ASPC2|nr:uncharacterized protein P168DRAFT_316525 [Aspergillus campestris IBT 28561]PKY06527.1 hypothetical protein P168DRAFT_316525 [Aspergillus campestris IBT 28561]
MPTSPPRRTFEKSRTVRRRYQRSNKRLKFSASQIARIEREEERERKAQTLREKEKRRVANRKKKVEKEAKAREERRRLGIPDPHAATVPSSQPLLFNFLKKGDSASVTPEAETPGEETDPGETTEVVGDSEFSAFEEEEEEEEVKEEEFGDANVLFEDHVQGDTLETGGAGANGSTEHEGNREGPRTEAKEEDEFSDCSVFYDEDILKRVENVTPAGGIPQQEQEQQPQQPGRLPISLPGGESFCDDTAILLEEFSYEFDTDEEFERELAQLDAV